MDFSAIYFVRLFSISGRETTDIAAQTLSFEFGDDREPARDWESSLGLVMQDLGMFPCACEAASENPT